MFNFTFVKSNGAWCRVIVIVLKSSLNLKIFKGCKNCSKLSTQFILQGCEMYDLKIVSPRVTHLIAPYL